MADSAPAFLDLAAANVHKPPFVIIGYPTGGDNMTAFTQSLLAMMGSMPPEMVKMRPCPCAGSNIAENQNSLADKVEEEGADYLLLFETDMAVPPNALMRLLAHNKDIVGACYPFKDHDLLARIMRGESSQTARLRYMGHLLGGEPIRLEHLLEAAPTAQLLAMNFVPMGLTLISRHALNAVRDKMTEMFPPPAHLAGRRGPAFFHGVSYAEDFKRGFVTTTDSAFCSTARDCGLEVWCDPALSLAVEHVGLMNFGIVSGARPAP